jgi:hypothetical protein
MEASPSFEDEIFPLFKYSVFCTTFTLFEPDSFRLKIVDFLSQRPFVQTIYPSNRGEQL